MKTFNEVLRFGTSQIIPECEEILASDPEQWFEVIADSSNPWFPKGKKVKIVETVDITGHEPVFNPQYYAWITDGNNYGVMHVKYLKKHATH